MLLARVTHTIASTGLEPQLAVSVRPSRGAATPGDGVAYSTRVSSDGAVITIRGQLRVRNGGGSQAHVVD